MYCWSDFNLTKCLQRSEKAAQTPPSNPMEVEKKKGANCLKMKLSQRLHTQRLETAKAAEGGSTSIKKRLTFSINFQKFQLFFYIVILGFLGAEF